MWTKSLTKKNIKKEFGHCYSIVIASEAASTHARGNWSTLHLSVYPLRSAHEQLIPCLMVLCSLTMIQRAWDEGWECIWEEIALASVRFCLCRSKYSNTQGLGVLHSCCLAFLPPLLSLGCQQKVLEPIFLRFWGNYRQEFENLNLTFRQAFSVLVYPGTCFNTLKNGYCSYLKDSDQTFANYSQNMNSVVISFITKPV